MRVAVSPGARRLEADLVAGLDINMEVGLIRKAYPKVAALEVALCPSAWLASA